MRFTRITLPALCATTIITLTPNISYAVDPDETKSEKSSISETEIISIPSVIEKKEKVEEPKIMIPPSVAEEKETSTTTNETAITENNTIVKTEEIKPTTRTIKDGQLPLGVTVVVSEGTVGTMTYYREETTAKNASQDIVGIPVTYTVITQTPEERVVREGTKNSEIPVITEETIASEKDKAKEQERAQEEEQEQAQEEEEAAAALVTEDSSTTSTEDDNTTVKDSTTAKSTKPATDNSSAESTTDTSSNDGKINYITPVSNTKVNSPFGYRVHPVKGIYKLHEGTDLQSSCDTPVKASADGTILYAKYKNSNAGNAVEISHGDMNGSLSGTSFTTQYYHLNSYTVKAGQKVKQGDIIGYVGSTGSSTGCHLHWGATVDSVPTDIMSMLENKNPSAWIKKS